jgi:hypothetical protein
MTIAFWAFAFSVALLPVGLGGNRPIPMGLAQIGLTISCLFILRGQKVWHGVWLRERILWAMMLIFSVLVWALMQALPFVPADWAHPLWLESSIVLGIPLRATISIAPENAVAGLTRLISYVVAGLLGYSFCYESDRARHLIRLLWFTGVGICIYGLAEHILGFETILWFKKWVYKGDLTATFVNRNHYAIYADIIMICGLSLTMQSLRDHMRSVKRPDRVIAIREWLKHEGLMSFVFLFLVFLSVILSHSRSGLILSILGMGSYLFAFALYKKHYRNALTVVFILAVILSIVAALATQYSDRFASLMIDDSSLSRHDVYRLTLHAIQDNPLLGYGLNGFQPMFRLYQSNMVMEFNRAHSDILESLLDLGIPAGLVLWAAILLLLSGLVHGIFHRQRNGMYPALGLAVSIIVLAHAAVDFSLQIPGISFTWAALLGGCLAQSWGHRSIQD